MKTLFLAFCALILISCGKTKVTYDQISSNYNVSPQLVPFLIKFQEESQKYNYHFNYSKLTMIVSNDIKYPTLGTCLTINQHPEYGQVIKNNPILFNQLIYDVSIIEKVIFHELGHCFLYRQHTDEYIRTVDDFKIQASIMNTYSYNNEIYAINRQAYLDELFKKSTNLDFYRYNSNEFPYTEYKMLGFNNN